MLRKQIIKSTSLALRLRDLDTLPESEQLIIDLGKSWDPTSAKNSWTFECITNVFKSLHLFIVKSVESSRQVQT